MSSKGIKWVKKQHPRRPSGRSDNEATLVLWWLAARDYENNPKNDFFASQQEIARDTGLGVSTVNAKLKLLEDGGYISRHRRVHSRGPRKGQRAHDQIVLHLDKPDDPDERTVEQPPALRAANRSRSREAAKATCRGQGLSDAQRREDWEEGLGDDWAPSETWRDDVADTRGSLQVVDAASGEVIYDRGSFTNANRPSRRRRPVDVWTQADLRDEILDRLWWVNPQSEKDVDLVLAGMDRLRMLTAEFRPEDETYVLYRLFDEEVFLDWIARDSGEAGHTIVGSIGLLYGVTDESGMGMRFLP